MQGGPDGRGKCLGTRPVTGTVETMNDPQSTAGSALLEGVPQQRPCTRCDGQQHLLGAGQRMGKYRCDTCQMVVGFDLDTSPAEFLLNRGLPSRYTKNVFGDRLVESERRLQRTSFQ